MEFLEITGVVLPPRGKKGPHTPPPHACRFSSVRCSARDDIASAIRARARRIAFHAL